MAIRSFLVLIMCGSVLVACAGSRAAEPLGSTCDQFQSTPTVDQSTVVVAGSDVKVVLCSNPSTGYAWGEPQIGDPAVLELVDRAYVAPDGASLPVVGAAGGEVLTFRAVAAGATTLVIQYGQPWEGGDKGAWTYRLSITVE